MPPSNDWSAFYEGAGRQYNVDPNLLRAVVSVESGGDPQAVSSAGAVGVAQLMPQTAKGLGVGDATDPQQAIYGAAKLLDQNLQRYGSPDQAILAYHGGTDQTNWGPKTQAYLTKVSSAYQQLPKAGASMAANPAPSGGMSDADLLAAFTGQKGASASSVTPAGMSDEELLKAFTAGPSKPVGQTEAQTAEANVPGVTGDHPLQSIRNAISDDPNLTYGNVLPFAKDKATGALARINDPGASDLFPNLDNPDFGHGQVAVVAPESVRSQVRGVLDLVEGASNASKGIPQPNQLSPDALNALTTIATLKPGGAQPSAGASNALIRDARANPLTATAPEAAPGVANLLTASTEQPMPAGGPAAPPEAVPAAAAATAPVATEAATAAGSGGVGAGAKLPKAVLPIVTKAQAGNLADKIIQTFAKNGNQLVDLSAGVEGSKPTLGQATGNGGIAALEQGLRSDPQFNNSVQAAADASNAARSSALAKLTGTPEDVAALEEERDATTSALRDKAFANKTPVDPTPVIQTIDNILESPAGQRSAVTSTLNQIRQRLATPVGNGTFERTQNDPEQLYGVRQFIGDLLDKQNDDKSGQIASSQLMQVKAALDPVIESGAPGFKDYLKEFEAQSQPITSQKYLQGLNLTNGFDEGTLAKYDSAIKAIQKAQGKGGVGPAQSVSPEQLSGLMQIRDDLRRAGVKPSGKIPGSSTVQNLATNKLLSAVGSDKAKLLGPGAASVGALTTGAALYGLNKAAGALNTRGQNMLMEALHERLLNPNLGANALTSTAKP